MPAVRLFGQVLEHNILLDIVQRGERSEIRELLAELDSWGPGIQKGFVEFGPEEH